VNSGGVQQDDGMAAGDRDDAAHALELGFGLKVGAVGKAFMVIALRFGGEGS
jgi:hypothetical protein